MALNLSAFGIKQKPLKTGLNLSAFGIKNPIVDTTIDIQQETNRVKFQRILKQVKIEMPNLQGEELTKEITRRRFGEQSKPFIEKFDTAVEKIKAFAPKNITELKTRISQDVKDIRSGVKEVREIKDVFVKGLRTGTLRGGSAVEQILSIGADKLGFEQISDSLQNLSNNDRELSNVGVNLIDTRKFSEKIKDPDFIAKGIGENLPNLAFGMGVALPAAIIGAPAIAVTASVFAGTFVLEAGFAYQDAKDSGASDSKAEGVALVVGIVNGLLETLAITKLLERIPGGDKIKKDILGKVATNVIKQSGLEAGTESLQEIVSNAVALTYDENRDLLQGVPESAFFGGLLGGGAVITGGLVSSIPTIGLTTEDVSGEQDAIPKELEPLAIEARKFNTAEEFIKAQPKVFHGTPIPFKGKPKVQFGATRLDMPDSKGVVAFSTNKKVAKNYSQLPQSSQMSISEMENELISRKFVQLGGADIEKRLVKATPKETEGLYKELERIDKLSRQTGVERVIESHLNLKNPLVVDNAGRFYNESRYTKWVKQARVEGRDGVIIKNTVETDNKIDLLGDTIMVFRDEAILDKSQLTNFFNQAKGVKEVRPPSAKKILGIEPAPFIETRKRETTLLKERIRGIQKSARTEANKKAEIARLRNQFESRLEETKRKGELKTLKVGITERFKGITKGIREGTVTTKAQIKSTQTEILGILKQSNLDAKDKEKFSTTIKNVQTASQLEAALPEITDRIVRLEEASSIREIKAKISKELKETKVKKVGGKAVGKFTPEIQNVLDVMREAIKLTKLQSEEKIIANINAYPEVPPVEVAMENAILRIANSDLSSTELQSLLNNIKEMKNTGKIINALRKFNIQEEQQRRQKFLADRVTGGRGIDEGTETFGGRRGFRNAMKKTLKSLGIKVVLDWQGLMTTIDSNNSTEDQILAEKLSTLDQDNKFKELTEEFIEDFNNSVLNAYDIKIATGKERILGGKEIQIQKKLLELNEDISIGIFENTDGIERELILTKDEMIKRWMEFQDPSLEASFATGNKFTEEIKEAISNSLTDQDKQFAGNQFAMYKKQWNKINPLYSKIYGVDLSFNDFYSPIRRKGFNVDATKGVGEFLIESTDRQALTSSSFKLRVKNTLAIEQQSSVEVLKRHIMETNYFIAWVEQVRLLRSDFSNNEVREAIKQEFGDSMLSAINNKIQVFTENGNKNASRNKVIDYFRKKSTLGLLMTKPSVGIKQMVSTLAYLEKLNPIQFTAGVADFWKHPIRNYKILQKESTLIRTRGANMERDIKAAKESDAFKQYSRLNHFMNTMMLNVKLGDKGAIITGSWAVRYVRLKEGKNISEIIREYEEFSSSTQQSADSSRLSETQLGGSFDKLFTQFKSSQRQYWQKEVVSIKSLFQRDGFNKANIKRVAKVMAIYHILLPVIFQYIANLGGWSEEDRKEYLRAGILGSLNGLFIAGDIIDSILRGVMGLRVWDNELPIFRIADVVNKAVRELDFDDITNEDVFNALFELTNAGNSLGIPIEQTKNQVAGFGDIMKGSVLVGLARIGGWSKFRAESKFNRKSDAIKIPSIKIPSIKVPSIKIPSISI